MSKSKFSLRNPYQIVAESQNEYLDTILNNIKHNNPITVVGMYDGGQDFLYNQFFGNKKVLQLLDYQRTDNLESIDISNKSLFIHFVEKPEGLSETFFQKLNELRTKYTHQFTYVLFGYSNLLNYQTDSPIRHKILLRNILICQPLNFEDTKKLINKFCNLYAFEKYLSKNTIVEIFTLSGGNPGLIKSLCLQVFNNHFFDNQDSDLNFRLEKIQNIIPPQYLNYLQKPKFNKRDELFLKLQNWGYINNEGEVFSKLLREKLIKIDDNKEIDSFLILSKQQKKLIEFILKNDFTKIITKDEIAKVIWEENWVNKYSNWAIDKLIHQLRKYLKGNNLGTISTIKGQGYIYRK